jgi:hypothetical protein
LIVTASFLVGEKLINNQDMCIITHQSGEKCGDTWDSELEVPAIDRNAKRQE